MSKNSFIEARETAIKRAQEAPERQKELERYYEDLLSGSEKHVGSTTSTVPSSTGTAAKGGKSGTSGEGELVGEIKQSDYTDESSISFSRWELMGFIIALIVGIIVSALIVVAVKNNKRDHNRTVKNAIACDMESEAEAFMATLKAVKKQKRF